MAKILLVEDDDTISFGIRASLEKKGYEITACTCLAGAKKLFSDAFALVLLDLNLPDGTGYELCTWVKARCDTPIIFLTVRDEVSDITRGLDMGADDYVTKPFTPLELLARVNSQLRRYSRYLEKLESGSREEGHVYRIGGLELDEERVELRVDGVPVKVTPMEYRILLLLMKHPGRVFSADEIYERVWNEKAVNSDTIMVHVRNIREKIEINPKNPKYLKVVWGVGYKMEKQ